MKVDLQKAEISFKPVIDNLIQLYEHDFTEVTPFGEAKVLINQD